MDLHSAGIVHYFEGDVVALELYAEPKVVAAIERLGLERLCLASADMGRAKWVATFANRLHAPVALIHKKRVSGSETHVSAVVGDVATTGTYEGWLYDSKGKRYTGSMTTLSVTETE